MAEADFVVLLLTVCRCLILYNLLAVLHHVCFFFCLVGQGEG